MTDASLAAVRRLPVEAAATYCGVSKSFLNKMRCVGGGPAYLKIGRRIVYETTELDAWLQRHVRRSTADIVEAA